MNKRKIKKAKSAMKGYAFIGLNLIGVLIFWTVPMLFSFIISISKWDYSKGIKGIRIQGFSNYVEMWRDAWFRASLINNIVFTVSYVAVLIVLSFMVAYVLNEYVIGKKFVQLGLYLPYIVNIVAISAVWLALFSNNGPILNLLRKIGMENPPVFVSDLRWARHCIDLYLAEPGIYSDPVSFRYDQCAKRSV
jgi:multiple sugar transport system permease protein